MNDPLDFSDDAGEWEPATLPLWAAGLLAAAGAAAGLALGWWLLAGW